MICNQLKKYKFPIKSIIAMSALNKLRLIFL